MEIRPPASATTSTYTPSLSLYHDPYRQQVPLAYPTILTSTQCAGSSLTSAQLHCEASLVKNPASVYVGVEELTLDGGFFYVLEQPKPSLLPEM